MLLIIFTKSDLVFSNAKQLTTHCINIQKFGGTEYTCSRVESVLSFSTQHRLLIS